MLGEANCIQNLGDIALAEARIEDARASYAQALALYERIPEPYSIGWAQVRLARIARNAGERRAHVQAAARAWQQIDRPDLLQRLAKEFGEDADVP
ncbi:MAG: hypothetical protein ABSD56_09595 [Bryobacteraceae bacterium]